MFNFSLVTAVRAQPKSLEQETYKPVKEMSDPEETLKPKH